MTYQEIRQLIGEGRLSEALERLIQAVEASGIAEKNEILLQSHRLNSTLLEKRMGVLSQQDSSLVVNQVANGILSLLDDLERRYPTATAVPSAMSGDTDLAPALSAVLGRPVAAVPAGSAENLAHLLKLHRIHLLNLQSAEEAIAKWGELAPSILQHKLAENREKLAEITAKIEAAL